MLGRGGYRWRIGESKNADDPEGPERPAHLEVAELRRLADAGHVALAAEVAHDQQLLRGQGHLPEPLLVVVGPNVARLGPSNAALDPAPRLDPADALHDEVGGAEPEGDALVAGIGAFLQTVEAFGPEEDAADHLARVVHDNLDQLFRLERALLDQDRAEPFALANRLARLVVLGERDLVASQQQLAEPVVAVVRGCEHEPAAR